MRLNWIDRIIAPFAPRTAARRGVARSAIDAARAYDGAATGRRTNGWRTPSTSADAEIGRALPLLRARSRDLTRNNPHARKAVNVWVNNIIGDGIVPRPKSGDKALNAKVAELWRRWADQADADGELDIYGLQDLMVREMVEGGEVIIRKRVRREADGLAVPLQLQVLEGDQLDLSKTGLYGDNRVMHGVEKNIIGRRSAYWLFPDHPGSILSGVGIANATISQRIDARDVIHLYRKERTQLRGMPWGSAVIRGLRDIDDAEVAHIVRAKSEACVVAIVTGADPGDEAIAPWKNQTTTAEAAAANTGMKVTDANGRPVEHFEPGLIAYAHGSKEVKFNNPQPSGGFVDYKKAGLKTVAAGYLVPYELLTGDLVEVNFSSARVGLIEFRRLCAAVQYLCVKPMALNRMWGWFLDAASLAKLLPDEYIPVEWGFPMFDSVNPLDDANADIKLIRAGIKTWDQAVAERGYDPDEQLSEIVARLEKFDDGEVMLDIDPRKVSIGGQEQPSQQAQEGAAPAPTEPVRRLRGV